MFLIDYQDPTPIYEQLVNRYKTMIAKGILPPGEQMPSVRSLAMELSINPNTIQKAYTELERQGFIYSVKGRGNFVAENAELKDKIVNEYLDRLDELVTSAEAAGLDRSVFIQHLEKGGEKQ